MSKYNNRRQSLNGFTFDSQAEAHRYTELVLRERAGEIHGLRVHPSYVLQESFRDSSGKLWAPITYVLDFSYFEGEGLVCEDVKGFRTSDWRMKQKLFLKRYPMYTLRIVDV